MNHLNILGTTPDLEDSSVRNAEDAVASVLEFRQTVFPSKDDQFLIGDK